MVVSGLTSSKYWDIGENCLSWTSLQLYSRLLQKQNEFIDVLTMIHQTSNRHIQTVMNNLKFIILNWRRDFCDWSISSHSIWKVMLSRHLTEYNILRDNAPHRHTQHWSTDQGCQVVISKKRQINPWKKPKSTEKSQIHDKYTTTPLKHPNALLKGIMYMFYT